MLGKLIVTPQDYVIYFDYHILDYLQSIKIANQLISLKSIQINELKNIVKSDT